MSRVKPVDADSSNCCCTVNCLRIRTVPSLSSLSKVKIRYYRIMSGLLNPFESAGVMKQLLQDHHMTKWNYC